MTSELWFTIAAELATAVAVVAVIVGVVCAAARYVRPDGTIRCGR